MKTKLIQPLSLLDNVNNPAEIADLFDSCSRDANAKKVFEQECIIDSLILSDCKNAPSIKNAHSEDEWNRLLDDSLAMSCVQYRFKRNSIPLTKSVKLLAAACIALLAGGLIVSLLHAPVNKVIYSNSISIDTSLTDTSVPASAVNVSRSDIMTSDSQSSIVMFDKKTAGVIGKKSHMTIDKKDTAVYLSLTSGAVLFTVEKGRYRSFTVVTPHAKIRVTGTTFRVDAMQSMTKVTVIEGSVKVIHDRGIDHDTVALADGNIAVADSVSIKEYESEQDLKLSFPKRKLLDDFIKNSLTIEQRDELMTELQADTLLLTIQEKEVTGLELYRIFTAANTFKSFKRYDDAMILYEYILDNADSSALRDNAACYLTWSLIQKKTEPGKKSAEQYMHAVNGPGDEKINCIRLFPGVRTQP
jgi:FecR protein